MSGMRRMRRCRGIGEVREGSRVNDLSGARGRLTEMNLGQGRRSPSPENRRISSPKREP